MCDNYYKGYSAFAAVSFAFEATGNWLSPYQCKISSCRINAKTACARANADERARGEAWTSNLRLVIVRQKLWKRRTVK